MMQIILIGIGAGAAAALLFASIATGSLLATLLFYLAPLPIMLAAIGWSHVAGLVAAFSAAIALGAVLNLYFFVVFLVGVGLPAWWLGYLALLARPASSNGAGTLEWYPIGRLVLWAALIGTLLVAVSVFSIAADRETFQAALRSTFERPARVLAPRLGIKQEADIQRLIEGLVVAAPPAAAVLATLLSSMNLWLAGRIVMVSGRLRRPWPELSSLALPKSTAAALAIAMVGSLVPGLLGILAGVLAASLFMAYAIMGFAVLHAITRGMVGRFFLLALVYASVLVLGWSILLVSMLGLAESAFNFRARLKPSGGPPMPKS